MAKTVDVKTEIEISAPLAKVAALPIPMFPEDRFSEKNKIEQIDEVAD